MSNDSKPPPPPEPQFTSEKTPVLPQQHLIAYSKFTKHKRLPLKLQSLLLHQHLFPGAQTIPKTERWFFGVNPVFIYLSANKVKDSILSLKNKICIILTVFDACLATTFFFFLSRASYLLIVCIQASLCLGASS